mmetsp:Transcript_13017/g.38757  ORF Transcript_13017/g.38757 Transcript_13017/m.38757 type:complete len:146 (-) Transcript_13017:352-789(-)
MLASPGSKNPFLVDYLQEVETGDIIYPNEAMAKCKIRPANYKLVPRPAPARRCLGGCRSELSLGSLEAVTRRPTREVDDAADKDGYEGSLALVLEGVPLQNDATGYDVRAEDIRPRRREMRSGARRGRPQASGSCSASRRRTPTS